MQSPANSFEKMRGWHLLLILVVLYGLLGIYKIIPLRPQSIHQWAQCDRASVAWNYYMGDGDFFHPRVNNTDNGTGITGLEFPIVQYFVSFLYRLFGFHEWLYRLTTLLVFTLGATSVFRLSVYFLEDKLQALLIMLLYVCSPLLAFYSCSFIPDIYSLSFAMIAWAALLRLKERFTILTLSVWFIPLLIACLIKPNSLIHLPVMWLFQYREGIWKKYTWMKLSGCFLTVISATFGWYAYASWLSKSVQSEVFLLQVRPPRSWQEIKDVWERVSLDWLERIYHPWILILIALVGLVFLFTERPIKNKLASYTLMMLMGAFAFLYVMFLQLSYHDYYFITMFPSLIFLLIFIFKSAGIRFNARMKYAGVVFIFGLLMIQFYFAKSHVRYAHKKESWMYGSVHNDRYFDSNYFLIPAGINPNDQVICLFDHSPNISLYLMGRRGVTVPYRNVSETLMTYLNSGRFKYVVYNQFTVIDDVTFNPEDFPLERVIDTNGIQVFKLSSSFQPSGVQSPLSPWN